MHELVVCLLKSFDTYASAIEVSCPSNGPRRLPPKGDHEWSRFDSIWFNITLCSQEMLNYVLRFNIQV
jgi:hypothetical protein